MFVCQNMIKMAFLHTTDFVINWNHLSEQHYDNIYQEALKAICPIFCYFLISVFFIKVVPLIYPMEICIKLLLQKEIKELFIKMFILVLLIKVRNYVG